MSRRESTSVPSRSHKMVVVVMISPAPLGLLFHAPIGITLRPSLPAAGWGYCRRHDIRRQLQLQRCRGIPTMAARGDGTYLFVTIAADWRAGHDTRSAYNPHAGAQACGVCPVGVKSYFQA